MNNTRNLYTKAKEYQDKRKAIVDAYEGRLASLERMKGSEFYEEEAKKAEAERNTALSSLKAEYVPGFEGILQEMKAVSGRRATTPPTEEELRLVQALKLRNYKDMPNKNLDLIAEELLQIAQAVKGNAMCLSIIQDVARENKIPKDYLSLYTGSNMPALTVLKILEVIGAKLSDFVDHDTNPVARMAREKHERQFGKTDETQSREKVLLGMSSGYAPVPKRELFDTQEDFYTSLFNITGEAYANFSAAVND